MVHLSLAETAINRFAVLATYRHLLRATRLAFKGTFPHSPIPPTPPLTIPLDDQTTLSASRSYAKAEFGKHRRLESGGVLAGQAVEHAQGVAKILREHVVQGKMQGEDGRYKLNIHEHTQRLDNDTAGHLKGTTKSWREVKDAVF